MAEGEADVVTSGFAQAVEAYHLAAAEFVKGNPEPYKKLFSQRDDVTLGNPFGPVSRGWSQVAETRGRAATHYRDEEVTGFENVATYETPDLAYIVEVERFRAKMGGSEEITSVALRTTSILRPEDGAWKIAHRHADPITSVRPVESVVQK
jgi:ketosteroid isomerase-like protein